MRERIGVRARRRARRKAPPTNDASGNDGIVSRNATLFVRAAAVPATIAPPSAGPTAAPASAAAWFAPSTRPLFALVLRSASVADAPLAYTAEPYKADRLRIGTYVLLFLVVFFIFAWLLNREYWKDVH